MVVLPAINELDFESVKNRLLQAVEILKSVPESDRWVHIDVADGTFTPNVLWHNSKELGELKNICQKFEVKIEAHLMVKSPERALGDWLLAGADRVVVHHEELELKGDTCLFGSQVVIGLGVKTTPAEAASSLEFASQVLLLSVPPGRAGQSFDEQTIKKIKFLRTHHPNVTIEIDGGVNLEVGKKLKEAGATVLVSASYIWNSENSIEAFQNLRSL